MRSYHASHAGDGVYRRAQVAGAAGVVRPVLLPDLSVRLDDVFGALR